MDKKNTLKILTQNRKKIEDLIDNFSRYVETGDCDKIIVEFFHKLSFYTDEYLINERLILSEKDNELFDKMVNRHREFANKLIEFQKDFEQKKQGFCKSFLNFLKSWYAEHILYFDENIMDVSE